MKLPKRSTVGPARRHGGDEIPEVLKEMLKGGLSLLWRGFEYARDLETDSWEFAVECESLYQSGLSAIDLRWLLARGYVESAMKTSPEARESQLFETSRPLGVPQTRFVLTKAGAALTVRILSPTLKSARCLPSLNGQAQPSAAVSSQPAVEQSCINPKPSWDRDRKVLYFSEWIIKQFRWLAVNQETVLMAFEEDGWPTRIDDPLPRRVNQDPKQRLHDTIKCLNRNHSKRVIRFNGDGTGEGIRWSYVGECECDE